MYSEKYSIIKLLSEATGQGLLMATNRLTLRPVQLDFNYITEHCPHVMKYYNYFFDSMADEKKILQKHSNTDLVAMFLSVMEIYTSVMPDSRMDSWFVTITTGRVYDRFAVNSVLGEYQFQDIGSYDSMLVLSQLNAFYVLERVLERLQSRAATHIRTELESTLKSKLSKFHWRSKEVGQEKDSVTKQVGNFENILPTDNMISETAKERAADIDFSADRNLSDKGKERVKTWSVIDFEAGANYVRKFIRDQQDSCTKRMECSGEENKANVPKSVPKDVNALRNEFFFHSEEKAYEGFINVPDKLTFKHSYVYWLEKYILNAKTTSIPKPIELPSEQEIIDSALTRADAIYFAGMDSLSTDIKEKLMNALEVYIRGGQSNDIYWCTC